MDRTQIIERAFGLVRAVARFAERVRRFLYEIALSKHACPDCGGKLQMIGESRCRCCVCRHDFDPTVAFQRCPTCGGTPRLHIRRYACSTCGSEVISRFVFDGLVFDADYFRQKMIEHWQRRREQRERVRQMLAESRSGTLVSGPADLSAIPGLAEALNSLTAGQEMPFNWQPSSSFDLTRYQKHIQAHIQPFALALDKIPPLGEHARLDRIWRFIASIFLAHAGLIKVWQDGPDVMVMQCEVDRKRSNISGDLEDVDGVEGSMGGVET